MTLLRHVQRATLAAATVAFVYGCASKPAPLPSAPPPPVLEAVNPAVTTLRTGLRAYDDGQYPLAEDQLQLALKSGLAAPRDRANAHKHLAFIYCTSQREKLCEAAFRAARADDPAFALSRGEAGHPSWGPVYRRVMASP